ncbi:MAG: hypothetical protein LLG14_24260 [Nocardiaceae bacterium]|nr:hypothetical protein [Nocardiaceae bacterium]
MTTVSGYSRTAPGILIPSREAQDLYCGWLDLLNRVYGAPKALGWDGERAVGRWRARNPVLTADCHAFRGTLGAKVVIRKPTDPEAKATLKRSILPCRNVSSPADLNTQRAASSSRPTPACGCWAAHRTTRSLPIKRR